ncbi:MAG: tRNA threonylcarbamoyl adenosine modification protein (Sua5/YciO/YrdC/YwlC family) [Flavobacteriales bacterium]
MLIEIRPNSIDSRAIDKVTQILKKGGVIAIPTDSVYSFACDLTNKKGLQKLARLKNIKLSKANFSLICYDLSTLSEYTKPIDRSTYKVMNRALPGPYTFILNASNQVPKLFDSNKKEIGIRIPDNEIARAIVLALGNPLAVTSIHNEDEILEYTNDPYSISEQFKNDLDATVDGGLGNLEASTILDCTKGEIVIVREGVGSLDIL